MVGCTVSVELATAYVSVVPSAKGFQGALAKELGAPVTAVGTKAGTDLSNSFSQSVGKTGAKLTKTLTPAAAAVGAVSAKIASSWNSGTDAIVAATGASGDALDSMTESMKTVGGQVPQNLGEVGEAIGEVNTRLGLSGAPLEDMTKKMLDLARISGGDVTSTIAATTRVFGDWGVATEDQSGVLDKLYATTQSSGIGLEKLSGLVVQFGAPLRQMGFSMEESIALFGKWEKEGVNTETAMSGMRQALGKLAKSGEDPKKAFADVSEAIKGAGSIAEANQLSMELFGSRAGPDMAAAIREGRFEIDDLVQGFGSSEGALDDAAARTLHLSDRFKMMANTVTGVVGPYAEMGMGLAGVAAGIGPVMQGLGAMGPMLGKVAAGMKLSVLWSGILKAATAVGTAIQWLFNAALTANPVGIVVVAIAALVAGLVWFFTQTEAGRKIIKVVWGAIKNAIGGVVSWFQDTAMPIISKVFSVIAAAVRFVWKIYSAYWSLIFRAIKSVIDWIVVNVWPKIKAVFSAIVTAVKWVFKAYKTYFALIFRAIKSVIDWIVANVWPKIQAVFSAIVTAAKWVFKAYKTYFALILGAVRKVIDWIVVNVWPKIKAAFDAAVRVAQNLADKFRAVWSRVREIVGTVVGWVKNYVIGNFNRVRDVTVAVFNRVRDVIVSAINRAKDVLRSVKDAIDNVIGWFKDIASRIGGTLGKIADKISGPFKSAFNAIANAWNSTIGKLSWTVPSWVLGPMGGKSISAPKLPTLAEGATVMPKRGGTLAILAEAGKAETVVDTGLINARMSELETLRGQKLNMPQYMTIVDANGQLMGTMKVAANEAVAGVALSLATGRIV